MNEIYYTKKFLESVNPDEGHQELKPFRFISDLINHYNENYSSDVGSELMTLLKRIMDTDFTIPFNSKILLDIRSFYPDDPFSMHEYVVWSRSKRNPDLDKAEQFKNALTGFRGEVGEYNDTWKKLNFHPNKGVTRDELLLELGDIMFYAVWLVDLFNYDFVKFEIELVDTLPGDEFTNLNLLSDCSPETFLHKDINTPNLINNGLIQPNNAELDLWFQYICGYVFTLAQFSNGTLESILKLNMHKLNKRYPEGFNG